MNKIDKFIKKKKRKKIILNIIEVVFLLLLIFSLTMIILWFIDNKRNEKILKKIYDYIVVENDANDTSQDDNDSSNNQNNIKIDFNKLLSINSDTVAYLKVNGTNIEYPVVKTTNNDFYLKHSFDKSYNSAGWVFMNYKNNLNESDKNITIFGHNTYNGSMFGTLKNILNKEWYDNPDNYKILFVTKDAINYYQVFSIYKIEKEDYYTNTNFNNETFTNFLENIKNRSIKDFNVNLNNTSNIITLSTCDINNKYRVVLHAKKM